MDLSENRRLLWFAFASQMAGWTGAALFIPVVPLFLKHLDATDVQVGYYSAAALVSLSFGPMLIGWLSDRYGRRDRMVLGCYALQVPIAYAMGRTDSLLVACALNIGLWTFGASTINLARAIFALNYTGGSRDRAFARLAIASPVSFVIGGVAGGRIIEAWGYPGLFTTMSACWLVAFLLWLGVHDRNAARIERPSERSPVNAALVLFCLAIGVQSIAFNWSEIAFPLRLESLGFSLPFITSMVSVSNLVSIPFVILAGRYAARVGNLNLLVGGIILFGLCRFGLAVVETGAAVIGLQVLTGIPAVFLRSVAAALLAGMGPDHSVGSRMSLLLMASGFGGAIGGAVGGHLLEAFDPDGLLVWAGCGMLFAALFMSVMVKDPTREEEAGAV